MKEKAITALKQSIEHWEKIVAGDDSEQIGSFHCALCRQYHAKECRGCPVKARTGLKYCFGSPFEAIEDFADRCLMPIKNSDPEFTPLAQAELDFLKSLLPKSDRQEIKREIQNQKDYEREQEED